MKAGHDIVILQKSEALPSQLPESLHQKGYATQIIFDLPDAQPTLEQQKDPFFIVDCGSDTEKGFALVKSLIDLQPLHGYPLIVIGEDIDGYENVLGRYFKLATTISTPCNSGDVLAAVSYVVKAWEKHKQAPEKEEKPEGMPAPREEVSEAEVLPEGLTHALYKQKEEIPLVLFEQLQRLNLFTRGVGGDGYPRTVNLEELKSCGGLPGEEPVAKVIEDIFNNAGKWGKVHLQRTLFICHSLLEPIGMPEELCGHVRTAAVLFAWSLVGKDRSLLKSEYTGTHGLILRKDLCSRIKDSAMRIATELSLPEVGKIVAAIGRIIGHEEAVSDSAESVAASLVAAADLVDRVCFANGHWNPRAAYSFLKRIKSGKVKDVHPAVLCCLLKFLSEAISSAHSPLVLPKGAARNQKFKAEAARIRDQEVGEGEEKVAIAALIPGMRLSRPLFAYDGKQILGGNLTLDQDLIYRIWQLSALRPLNGPAVVSRA